MTVSAVNGTQQKTQVADSVYEQQANQVDQTFNSEPTEDDKNMGLQVQTTNQDQNLEPENSDLNSAEIFANLVTTNAVGLGVCIVAIFECVYYLLKPGENTDQEVANIMERVQRYVDNANKGTYNIFK